MALWPKKVFNDGLHQIEICFKFTWSFKCQIEQLKTQIQVLTLKTKTTRITRVETRNTRAKFQLDTYLNLTV